MVLRSNSIFFALTNPIIHFCTKKQKHFKLKDNKRIEMELNQVSLRFFLFPFYYSSRSKFQFSSTNLKNRWVFLFFEFEVLSYRKGRGFWFFFTKGMLGTKFQILLRCKKVIIDSVLRSPCIAKCVLIYLLYLLYMKGTQ